MGVLDEVLLYFLLSPIYADGGVESGGLRSWRGVVEKEEQEQRGKNKDGRIVTKKEETKWVERKGRAGGIRGEGWEQAD